MRRRRRNDGSVEAVDKTDSKTKSSSLQLTTDGTKLGTINMAHSSTDSLTKSGKIITPKVARRTSNLTKILTSLPSLFKRSKTVQLPPLDFAKLRSELTKELEHASELLSASSYPDTLANTVNQLTHSVWLIRRFVASGAACLQPVLHVAKGPDNSLRPVLEMKNQVIMEKLFQFHDSYVEFIDWISQLSAFDGDLPNGKTLSPSQANTLSAPATPRATEHSLVWLRGQSVFSDLKTSSLAIFDLLDSFGFTKPIDPSVLEQAVQSQPSWSSESAMERTTQTGPAEITSEHFLTDADRILLAKLWSHLDELNNLSVSHDLPPKPPVPQPAATSTSLTQESPTHSVSTPSRAPPTASRKRSVLDDPKLPDYLNALVRAVQSDRFSLDSRRSSTSSFAAIDSKLHPSELDLNSPNQLNFPAADASDSDNEEDMPATHGKNVEDFFTYADRRPSSRTGPDAQASTTCTTRDDPERFFTPSNLPQTSAPTVDTFTPSEFKIIPSGDVSWDRAQPSNVHNPLDDGHMLQDIATVTMHLQDQDFASTSPKIVVAPARADGTGPDLNRVVSRDFSYDTSLPPEGMRSADKVPPPDFGSDSSDSDCDVESGISHLLNEDTKPSEDMVHISGSDCDSCPETEVEPPQKPSLPIPLSSRGTKRPLSAYMFQFGSTLHDDEDVDDGLPDRLLRFFRDGWHKSELVEGPHSRSKVLSYVQSYGEPTPTGELIHRSTCVEHTCSVRLVGGLEGLKSQYEHLNTTDRNLNRSVGSICIDDSPPSLARMTDSLFIPKSPNESVLLQERLASTSSAELVGSFPPCRSILSLVKADDYLVWADSSSSGEVVVQAGIIDAFVVYLTSFGKTSPSFYLFFETFLDMYPSFLSTKSLIDRLLLRYRSFRIDGEEPLDESKRQLHTKVCSATASIVVTVVSRLKTPLTPDLQKTLLEFQELLLADNLSSLSRVLAATVHQQLSLMQGDHSHPYTLAVSSSTSEISEQPDECRKVHSDTSEGSTVISEHSDVTSDDSSSHQSTPALITVPKIKRRFLKRTKTRTESFEKSSAETVPKVSYFSPRSERIRNFIPLAPSKSLLSFSARELAEQFTFLDAEKYYRIRLSELLDIPSLERGEAPSVTACANHFSAVTNWTASQLLTAPVADRGKYANHLLNVMEHLRKLKNFSSYLSVLCAFLLVPECILCRRSRARLSKISSYMQPPYFAEYRRDLEAADPPFIPYLGVMMQNLIVLAQNNPLTFKHPPKVLENVYKPEHGPIINFWRCWKHFLIIHFIIKQESIHMGKSRYSIKPRKDVLRFLNDFKDSLTEIEMHRLINRLRRAAT